MKAIRVLFCFQSMKLGSTEHVAPGMSWWPLCLGEALGQGEVRRCQHKNSGAWVELG